jgi:hypothetical protein
MDYDQGSWSLGAMRRNRNAVCVPTLPGSDDCRFCKGFSVILAVEPFFDRTINHQAWTMIGLLPFCQNVGDVAGSTIKVGKGTVGDGAVWIVANSFDSALMGGIVGSSIDGRYSVLFVGSTGNS